MVIASLKAAQSALKEAMKDKAMSDASRKKLEESEAALQKLLDKAREAASTESYQGEEEEGMPTDTGEVDPHKIKPGHKMTKTVTVKHDGPKADGDGEEEEEDDKGMDKGGDNDGDEKDEKDAAEESRKVHLQILLKEAGIPETICKAEQLMKLSLKEAKAAIAEKKAILDEAKKAVDQGLDFVPTGAGTMHESTGGENLNSLFTGCAG